MQKKSRFNEGPDDMTMRCPVCYAPIQGTGGYCIKCSMVLTTGSKFTVIDTASLTPLISNDTLSGRVLDGKYKLLRQLGVGGMGIVYLAHRLHLGDKVAVKVLNRQSCSNEVVIRRFRREATIAAASKDPRIVQIYDSGETPDGIIYLVMEFIISPTLRTLLKREGQFSPERAVALLVEICAGIDAAHRQGIVHRDLKPENIMVLPTTSERDHESVVIVDFGIAKPLNLTADQILTEPGAMLGTLFYMSPEQLRGDEIDVRADIYSLGVVLYEMLTGYPPQSGLSVAEVIAKHILEEPPPLPPHLKIRPRLEAVIMRALAKDPHHRYATAKEFASELCANLRSSLPPAKRKSWLDMLTRFDSLF